jgi:hypothetical protein
VTLCRTLAEIEAAADAASAGVPPLSQQQVNRIAVIVAPWYALKLAESSQ